MSENGTGKAIRDTHFTLAISGEDVDGAMIETVKKAIEDLFHVSEQADDPMSDERGTGPGDTVLLGMTIMTAIRSAGGVSDLDPIVLRWRHEYPLLGKNVGATPAPEFMKGTAAPSGPPCPSCGSPAPFVVPLDIGGTCPDPYHLRKPEDQPEGATQ